MVAVRPGSAPATLTTSGEKLLVALLLSQSAFADIEKPVKGKRYTLTEKHGPWMIMVAAIRDIEDEERRIDGGMTAWQAADEIVFALREKGIPAYTYAQEKEVANVSDGAAQGSSRRYIAQHGYISVMAGNFPSNEDSKAVEALEFIKKKFSAKFLADEKNGGIFAKTPVRPSPFSRAFMTVNPLWKGEVRDAEEINFIVGLNADKKYSLLKNKAKYTLVVATFQGGSVMQVGNKLDSTKGLFDTGLVKDMDACGMNAQELAENLRRAKKFGYDENFEAWEYHDKFKSIVTIGSFNSKDDPQMRALATKFGGKVVRNPRTGDDALAGEAFTIPRYPKAGQLVDRSWVFDATPKIMKVPKVD